MKHILFVCTGNTCRSPMAEAILKDLIRYMPVLRDKLTIGSAGIMALNGAPMSDAAVIALSELQIRVNNHSSRCLTRELIEGADLILTMDQQQLDELLKRYPQAGRKAYTLYGYAGNEPGWGIADPYGQPPEEYLRAARQLHSVISGLVPMLERFIMTVRR